MARLQSTQKSVPWRYFSIRALTVLCSASVLSSFGQQQKSKSQENSKNVFPDTEQCQSQNAWKDHTIQWSNLFTYAQRSPVITSPLLSVISRKTRTSTFHSFGPTSLCCSQGLFKKQCNSTYKMEHLSNIFHLETKNNLKDEHNVLLVSAYPKTKKNFF